MSWGLIHRTTLRWLTPRGTETLKHSDARPFDTEADANAHRATLEAFADAWLAREIAPVRDGDGSVIERAAAWTVVERAVERLNEEVASLPEIAAPDLVDCSERFRQARIVYMATPVTAPNGASREAWRVVATEQAQILAFARVAAAGVLHSLRPALRAVDEAIAEYRRIGGSKHAAPGVGGLS